MCVLFQVILVESRSIGFQGHIQMQGCIVLVCTVCLSTAKM